MTYTITSNKTELPKGANFSVTPGPVAKGDLALFEIGESKRLTFGRWFPDVAGIDWIVQPSQLIMCDSETPVRIVGAVKEEAAQAQPPARRDFAA